VVWDGERLVVTELDVRDPGPGEVQVAVLASGICHSDLNVMEGMRGPRPPVVVGHEAAGVVHRLGEGVGGIAVGDPVVVGTLTPCGSCRACEDGRYTDCVSAFGQGATPFSWNGRPVRNYANCSSFAGIITVQARQLVPAPGLDPKTAALVGCAVSTGYGVVRNVAKVREGDTVVVFGVGGIGVNALQTCRLQGAATIVAVDVNPDRADVAERFGADTFVTAIRDGDVVAAIRERVDAPIDAAIECSGAPAAIDAAVRVVDAGGVTALVGIPPAGTRGEFDIYELLRGRSITGSLNGAIDPARDLPDIVRLVTEGGLDVASQVTGVWPLDRVEDAVAALRRGEVVRAVLDHTR
jgi:S-(hydroxymethyl)glutathione dehydrogenase/alcohol dehydrogenase